MPTGYIHLELFSAGHRKYGPASSSSQSQDGRRFIVYSDWASTTYQAVTHELVDGSLSISPPRLAGRGGGDNYFGYGPRNISFEIRLKIADTNEGASDRLIAELERLSSIIATANSEYHRKNVGYYADVISYGLQEGDLLSGMKGCVLMMGVDEVGWAEAFTPEGDPNATNFQGVWNKLLFFWNVISGSVDYPSLRFDSSDYYIDDSGNLVLDRIRVDLVVEPFCATLPYNMGSVVSIADTTRGGNWWPLGGAWYGRRIESFVTGSSLPCGLRIYADVSGKDGIIVSRFAGCPVWEVPSIPKLSSGATPPLNGIPFFVYVDGPLDIWHWTKAGSSSNRPSWDYLQVDLDGAGNFRYKFGATAGTWSAYQAIQKYEPIQIYTDTDPSTPGSSIYLVFSKVDNTGAGSLWDVKLNQYELVLDKVSPDPSLDPASQWYYEYGVDLGDALLSVPSVARGRYLIWASFKLTPSVGTAVPPFEVRARVFPMQVDRSDMDGGYKDDYIRPLGVGVFETQWVQFPLVDNSGSINSRSGIIGVLDLTADGAPAMMHPLGQMLARIEFRARSMDTSITGVSISLQSVMLLSAQDESSTFIASWGVSPSWRVISSFDLDRPYVGASMVMDNDKSTAPNSGIAVSSPTFVSSFGKPVSLVGSQDNYLMVIPMESFANDWTTIDFDYIALPKDNAARIYVMPRFLYPRRN